VLLTVGAVLSVLVVVVGVLALVSSPKGGSPKSGLVGLRLPGFTIASVGQRGNVSSPWSSGHPTVLLFFAKWCTVCHGEVPTLARALGVGDVGATRIVGIDEDYSAGVAAAFVSANHVRFPVGHDPLESIASQLGLAALPVAVFVRGNGRIADVRYGPLSVAALRSELVVMGS
jgi:thiol-disulfide isomerase/thioredoxin